VDVDLVLADQMQQEVEGTLEGVDLDRARDRAVGTAGDQRLEGKAPSREIRRRTRGHAHSAEERGFRGEARRV
jgi:hypothetical protein